MEELFHFDSIFEYQFGLFDPNWLMSLKEAGEWILFDSKVIFKQPKECDMITLYCEDDCILELEHAELEMSAGQVYFLKPPPPPKRCIYTRRCIVKKYIMLSKIDFDNQLAFVRERFIDVLSRHIGSKKLALTCWPFRHISLKYFLDNCKIPFSLIIELDETYRYPPSSSNRTRTHRILDPNYDYLFLNSYPCKNTLEMYTYCTKYRVSQHLKRISDINVNGHLFYDGRQEFQWGRSRLIHRVKRIEKEYYFCEGPWTGFPEVWDPNEETAFIIFNPNQPTIGDDKEVLLPITIDHANTATI
jgi:Pyruvate/2-oxoacid:ferredoxin oxidoreductase delta subunit